MGSPSCRICRPAVRVLLSWLAVVACAAAQTVFVVRHAERTGEGDTPLNADGLKRAAVLARVLADAGVQHIFTSDTIRARQTAEPLAKQGNAGVETIGANEIAKLAARVREAADSHGATLVVGHSNTLPQIVNALGGGDIPAIAATEHDRLIVLTLLPEGKAAAVTLRYGP